MGNCCCSQPNTYTVTLTGRVVDIHNDYTCDVCLTNGKRVSYLFWQDLDMNGKYPKLIEMDEGTRDYIKEKLLGHVIKFTGRFEYDGDRCVSEKFTFDSHTHSSSLR